MKQFVPVSNGKPQVKVNGFVPDPGNDDVKILITDQIPGRVERTGSFSEALNQVDLADQEEKITCIGFVFRGVLISLVLVGSGLIALKQPFYFPHQEKFFDPGKYRSAVFIGSGISLVSNVICNASIFKTFDFVKSCRLLVDSLRTISASELPRWKKGIAYSAWTYLLLNIPLCMIANGELTAESPPSYLTPDSAGWKRVVFDAFFVIGMCNFGLTRVAAPGRIVLMAMGKEEQKFAEEPPKWVARASKVISNGVAPLLLTAIGYAMYAPKLPKGFDDLNFLDYKLCPDKSCLELSTSDHFLAFSQSLVTPSFFWVVSKDYVAHFYDMLDQIKIYHKEKNCFSIGVRVIGITAFIVFVGYAGVLGLVSACPVLPFLPSQAALIGFFMINTCSLTKTIRDYYQNKNEEKARKEALIAYNTFASQEYYLPLPGSKGNIQTQNGSSGRSNITSIRQLVGSCCSFIANSFSCCKSKKGKGDPLLKEHKYDTNGNFI